MSVVAWQRVEAAVVAFAVLAAFPLIGGWMWLIWPFALFLLFDLSALGYLGNPRIGALFYNLVHNWAGPTALILVWVLEYPLTYIIPTEAGDVLIVTGLAWLFHVAADRALGYGLKHADAFQHTHLGWIGKRGREDAPH